MYDANTVELIRQAPPLEGVDLAALPQELTKAYASIVAARLRLRDGAAGGLPPEIGGLVARLPRLAAAHEGYVSVLPDRPNRAAAAFVAASAHHACYLADQLSPTPRIPKGALRVEAVSPDVAATLLFLIAENAADAMEMAKRIRIDADGPVETALLAAIADLARGQLGDILKRPLPAPAQVTPGPAFAVQLLWLHLLRGVRALAATLLGPRAMVEHEVGPLDALRFFDDAKAYSVERLEPLFPGESTVAYSVYPGPRHLATLLSCAAADLERAALVTIPPPSGLDSGQWLATAHELARKRPYLWPNHRKAIAAGYLERGVSSVVSFPTGGGKSTLAELKIAIALQRGEKVVFLAPTLALVGQVESDLQTSFPTAWVQQEMAEEGGFRELGPDNELPSIAVMTPERCLARLGSAPDAFAETGLLVFDECHLLHPKEDRNDRRSVDAMLCLLAFTHAAKNADILMLSAMMSNAAYIAEWVESLIDRRCLALSFDWRPTRQARGCVVYDAGRIQGLKGVLRTAYDRRVTKGVPLAVEQTLTADPFGLFCLRQTWQSQASEDYSLLRLIERPVTLGAAAPKNRGQWYLTANRNSVAAAIAAATGDQGIKTLIFAQTIRMCDSTASEIRDALSPRTLKLTAEEERLFKLAVEEAGGEAHICCSPTSLAASHHGLLLPAERRLHEELFRRQDGINVLVATSTLAQGMNLPGEVVVIAGDDRFDPGAGKAKQLQAHEILNAAGRAGRAGEAAQALVIIVPSKVITFDEDTKVNDPHWRLLQSIFSRSDQCLEVEDPIDALLDQIQAGTDPESHVENYFLNRLQFGSEDDDEAARELLGRTLGAFYARRRGDADWVESRIAAALARRRAAAPDPATVSGWHARLAGAHGVPASLIHDLDTDMHKGSEDLDRTTVAWVLWFLDWLAEAPMRLRNLVRPSNIEYVFGKEAIRQPTEEARYRFVLGHLRKLVRLWITGSTLRELEVALGTPPRHLGPCHQARKFALRLVPDLASGFGLIGKVHQQRLAAVTPDLLIDPPVPLVIATLSGAVRDGFDSADKLALYRPMRRKLSRVGAHALFEEISPHVPPGGRFETFADALRRVGEARREWEKHDSAGR